MIRRIPPSIVSSLKSSKFPLSMSQTNLSLSRICRSQYHNSSHSLLSSSTVHPIHPLPSSSTSSSSSNSLFFGQSGRRTLFTSPIPQECFLQPPTIITTLPNGFRVATQHTSDETVTSGVFIDSGSRYETKATNGVAHFLEHMVFKGTKRRTRVALEKEVEDMGAHLNAYTAREQTVYYAKSFKKDVPQAVDILSDILTNSVFHPDAIEEERHVILREMEEVEKSYEELIFDRLHMTAFRDCSLGYTILGPPENVRGIKREWILDYIKKNYTADRMVLAAAGSVEHKEMVALAEKHFGHYPGARKELIEVKKEKPYFLGSQLLQKNEEMGPTVHAAIAFQSVEWTHPLQPVFMLMQTIVGSYNRENEGLIPGKISGNRITSACANKANVGCVDYYSGFNTCYKDTGLFGFYIQADERGMLHSIEELQFGVCCLAHSVTEEEVQRAKHVLKTNLFGSLDTTTAICEDIGRQVLVYNRRVPMAELYKRIDAIDSDEVRRTAWEYLYDQEIASVGIGKTCGIFPIVNLRARTYLHRW